MALTTRRDLRVAQLKSMPPLLEALILVHLNFYFSLADNTEADAKFDILTACTAASVAM